MGTNVTDAGLEHLNGLTQLQSLDLRVTNVTDAWLKHLKELTQLQSLDLRDTKVTDTGVEYLHMELPDCKIEH
jgi:Leucine-rich repeat (LRR) protein